MKLSLTVGLCAVGLLLTSVASQAADYCVTFPGFVIVGKGFKVPPKGNCKPWNGFSAQSGHNSPSNGTGCTSSDGSQLNLMFITAFAEVGDSFEEDQMTISLPSGAVTDHFTNFSGGTGSSGGPVAGTAHTCTHNPIPAVTGSESSSQLGNTAN